jgi:hypothetical protein
MSNNNVDNKLLDPEFEHSPVPKEYRKSLSSVGAVWFSDGFDKCSNWWNYHSFDWI